MSTRRKTTILVATLLLTLVVFTSPSTAQISCVDVEKNVFPEVARVGDTVTYEICVTNCGDTELSHVMGEDSQLGFIFDILTLAPDETWCHFWDHVVYQPDPVWNEVVVFGWDESGNLVEDSDDAVVDLIHPCIDVEKSVIEVFDDIVTYEICVFNCGDTMLMDIIVDDPQLGLFDIIPILLPGEFWCEYYEYVIQPDDPDPLINEVWALGWAELFYPVEDFDYAAVDLEEVGTVAIDIKPMSCPNPVNIKSKGVLPVAILGAEDLDVMEVDLSSLELRRSDHPEYSTPVKIEYEDVATPFDGELCDCHEEGSDGILDLVLYFETQEVVAALGPVVDGDELILTLTGEVIDGNPIEGSDCIRVIKKGKD